jgi:hypothetical protein
VWVARQAVLHSLAGQQPRDGERWHPLGLRLGLLAVLTVVVQVVEW